MCWKFVKCGAVLAACLDGIGAARKSIRETKNWRAAG
jgi:hypothetical protein